MNREGIKCDFMIIFKEEKLPEKIYIGYMLQHEAGYFPTTPMP